VTEGFHPDPEWWFEEWSVGQRFKTMTRTPTEFDVMTFVTTNGYFEELWFNRRKDVEDALGTRNLVPGPLTLVMAEGLFVQTGRMHHAVGFLGLDEVRWTSPVAIGDGIYAVVEVTTARSSSSSPDRGIVELAHTVRNHDGTVVMTYKTARLIKGQHATEL
jgi:acyl dehydratase